MPTPRLGAWSEVRKLHQVMACRPGLAHERLTPANCKELLFDDVLWVEVLNMRAILEEALVIGNHRRRHRQ
ncbi:hypothetical protein ACL1HT_11385 [Corynebacterium striatum]|uniref:hypothetical protein n=1 Tax=Corynebacterium striatum TaxID=43770 RepID=UPI00156241EA|nr:hypothetical protein [Corynebacterium striatum]MDC7105416.1 hypothetical protein [Corynebacterium striatum]MDK8787896.1 hypothetical protein [Corynebacterium striatum]MDK8825691.1 hypothetical protein [Corynebacterium striatum]MDK8832128.1 hypothetical protein [Corynebacterium striatum]MDK8880857.1 hypothetical protein [Corynebacterium striatum]